MAGCRRAKVTIQTVTVHKAESFGIFGEPGGSAEWDMQFVTGQVIELRVARGVPRRA